MKISEKTVVKLLIIINLIATLAVVTLHAYASKTPPPAPVKTTAKSAIITAETFPFLAAAVAVSMSCLASGIALAAVAKAGFAASAERPELKTYILILGGLAEGIAIYGLLVAIMILGKI